MHWLKLVEASVFGAAAAADAEGALEADAVAAATEAVAAFSIAALAVLWAALVCWACCFRISLVCAACTFSLSCEPFDEPSQKFTTVENAATSAPIQILIS